MSQLVMDKRVFSLRETGHEGGEWEGDLLFTTLAFRLFFFFKHMHVVPLERGKNKNINAIKKELIPSMALDIVYNPKRSFHK